MRQIPCNFTFNYDDNRSVLDNLLVKGYYFNNKIRINLFAFKFLYKIYNKKVFIDKLSKTISHEYLHYIIDKILNDDDIDDERIVMILNNEIKWGKRKWN